jgi:hypothetical protein
VNEEWEDNVGMKGIGFEDMDWIQFAQVRVNGGLF